MYLQFLIIEVSYIWCRSNESFIFSFAGKGFIGVCLYCSVSNFTCCMVNIYSSYPIIEKTTTWANFVQRKEVLNGDVWCIMRDFNSMCYICEIGGK